MSTPCCPQWTLTCCIFPRLRVKYRNFHAVECKRGVHVGCVSSIRFWNKCCAPLGGWRGSFMLGTIGGVLVWRGAQFWLPLPGYDGIASFSPATCGRYKSLPLPCPTGSKGCVAMRSACCERGWIHTWPYPPPLPLTNYCRRRSLGRPSIAFRPALFLLLPGIPCQYILGNRPGLPNRPAIFITGYYSLE